VHEFLGHNIQILAGRARDALSEADDFRLAIHQKFSGKSLVDWISETVRPLEGWSLLDIGCGTGEQLLHLVHQIGKQGRAVGLDRSEAAIKTFRRRVLELNLKNVQSEVGDMDAFEKYLSVDSRFDLILSNFAIYYAKNPEKLLAKARSRLKEGGFIFLSGPARHNNQALLNLHHSIGGAIPAHYDPDEMEGRIMDAVRKSFSNVEASLFWNPVTFPSPDILIDYWKSYFLYDRKYEEKFVAEARKYFEEHNSFVTVKEVIGIKAR
jgi:SAM-dependent methyltransferase